MPYLGDYIGYLMSEITQARAQADYEAIRIAEKYAQDPYLMHLPIPRFRMPNVTLDVPLIINNVQESHTGKQTNDRVLSYMQAKFRSLLPKQLGVMNTLKLKSLNIEKMNTKTDAIFEEFKQLDSAPLRITYIADKLVSSVINDLQDLSPSKEEAELLKLDELGNKLKQQLYSEFSKYLRDQPRLDITANTAELRNAGPKDILAYLRFTITEEAVEWTPVEENKVKTRRLVPE